MDISVVIPIYGCRDALYELYTRLSNTLKKLTDDYEIILVNDACPQGSWEVIEEICSSDKKVKGINLSRNFGQHKAILAGLDECVGDAVVVMDCDLQDRPEHIEKMYAKLQEGYDVVWARRVNRKDTKIVRFLSKKQIWDFAPIIAEPSQKSKRSGPRFWKIYTEIPFSERRSSRSRQYKIRVPRPGFL